MEFNWVNDASRATLSKGYLLEGVTAEERVREISDLFKRNLIAMGMSEELATEIANKFYDNFAKGWYSMSSPCWANYGLERGLPVSCLTGDSWIHTELEGGKQIRDLEVGDKVLTHKHRRYRQVTDIQTRESQNDLYKLKVQTRLTPIKITGNHPVLTNLGWVRVDELNPKTHLIATPASPIEREVASHVMRFDSWNTYNDNSSQFQRTHLVEQEVDEDLAWAFGLWFGDGSLSRRSKKESQTPSGIRITGSLQEREVLERFLKIFQSKFNLNGNIYESTARGRTKKDGTEPKWLTLNVNSAVLGSWFLDNFGQHFDKKQVPLWLKRLPAPLLKSFYKGFYQADGAKQTEKGSYITIANPSLAMSLFEVGLNAGYRMGLQMQEKAGKLSTTAHVYKVITYGGLDVADNDLSRFGTVAGVLWSDGLRYCPFSLEKLNHNEKVWDITVEEDHSFTVSGVTVHNCFSGYIDDTRDSIFSTHSEMGELMANGGGTAGYFGALRPRGAPIKDKGYSSGPVHFMQMFDTLSKVVSQGSVRRGFFSPYLDIEHPDIDEFLNIGTEGNEIQNMTTGVVVGDEFMNRVKDGDEDARKIWAKVLKRRSELGFPYIMFRDNANNNKPEWYADMPIVASNMCKHPCTLSA